MGLHFAKENLGVDGPLGAVFAGVLAGDGEEFGHCGDPAGLRNTLVTRLSEGSVGFACLEQGDLSRFVEGIGEFEVLQLINDFEGLLCCHF